MKTAVSLLGLFLMLHDTLLAGNTLDLTGNPTATPLVAFSLRRLSSAYTGYTIQVRRSSDGTTANIGFTSAGDLDTATLNTFVGSGTGYVTCWFDQSGNGYNATQTTAADQPTIMISGVINRENGKPALYTSGATGFLSYGPVTALNNTIPVTRMEVAQSRTDAFSIIEGLGYYQLDLQLYPDSIWVQYETGNIVASSGAMATTSTLMSINSVRTNGACQLYVNTTLLGSATASITNFTSPVMGYIGVRFDYVEGNAQSGAFSETILFNSVLSAADRQSINYNENWYYSLGFDVCSSTQASLCPNGTTTNALYACTQDGPWTYYYNPAHPLNLLFGIAADPNSVGANPTFVVDSIGLTATTNPTTVDYSATSGTNGIFALGRYWNVYTHTPLTSPVNVRFFYNPADTIAALDSALAFKSAMGASTISNLQWFKTVGGLFNPDSLTATPTPGIKGPILALTPVYGTKNGINYAEFDGVPSFSGGTGVYIVSNTLTVLHIVINPFTGVPVNNTVLLNWTTQSEFNSLLFDIERSNDGKTWTTIGQVNAAGSSGNATSYSFTDISPLSYPNNNYYRLKLVYKNGQYVYSDVVAASIYNNPVTAPQLYKVVPNPFESDLEIIGIVPDSGPVEIQLLDMTGTILMHQGYTANKGENVFTLTNLNRLSQGVYIVVVMQEGVVGVGKVVKE